MVDVYHEHEAVEAARDSAKERSFSNEAVDPEDEELSHQPMAMGDVGDNMMNLLGSIFNGPAQHPPLMVDSTSQSSSFLRGRGFGGGRPGMRPLVPRPPMFWRPQPESVGRPPVPRPPLYEMPTGVRPPMRLSVGVPPPHGGVMPPHLPLGQSIQHMSTRLPLGEVIGAVAEADAEAEEDEHELEEAPAKLSKMMDQIVAEEKKVAHDSVLGTYSITTNLGRHKKWGK